MPAGNKFGIQQVPVDHHFKFAAISGDETDLVNLGFEIFEQFGCQTGSIRGVVSDRAVGDGDVQQHAFLLWNAGNYNIGESPRFC